MTDVDMPDPIGSAEAGPVDEEQGFADAYDEDEPDGNRVVGAIPRAVLEHVARSIVDDPEAVVIEAEEGRRSVNLRLHVAPGDMGRVIGRRGRVAQAIRTLVRAAGTREGVDAQVDIVD